MCEHNEESGKDEGEIERLRAAVRDAIALCQYLERVWPEVGELPSVQETKAKCAAAL